MQTWQLPNQFSKIKLVRIVCYLLRSHRYNTKPEDSSSVCFYIFATFLEYRRQEFSQERHQTFASLFESFSHINKPRIASKSSKNNTYWKSSTDQTEKQTSKHNLKSPDLWTIHLHHKSDLIVHWLQTLRWNRLISVVCPIYNNSWNLKDRNKFT